MKSQIRYSGIVFLTLISITLIGCGENKQDNPNYSKRGDLIIQIIDLRQDSIALSPKELNLFQKKIRNLIDTLILVDTTGNKSIVFPKVTIEGMNDYIEMASSKQIILCDYLNFDVGKPQDYKAIQTSGIKEFLDSMKNSFEKSIGRYVSIKNNYTLFGKDYQRSIEKGDHVFLFGRSDSDTIITVGRTEKLFVDQGIFKDYIRQILTNNENFNRYETVIVKVFVLAEDPLYSSVEDSNNVALPIIDVTPKTISFVNRNPEDRIFIKIFNKGQANLIVKSVEKSGIGSDFLVLPKELVQDKINPNQLKTYEIHLTNEWYRHHPKIDAKVKIVNNDRDIIIYVKYLSQLPCNNTISISPLSLSEENLTERSTLRLNIQNTSNCTLILKSIQISGNNSNLFRVISPPRNLGIPMGQSKIYDIEYTPNSHDNSSATANVHIISNAGKYNVPITIITSECQPVVLTSVDGENRTGTDCIKGYTFTIKNNCKTQLRVSDISADNGNNFLISGSKKPPFQIVPGGSYSFSVNFHSDAAGNYSTQIRIKSNSFYNGEIIKSLVCEAVNYLEGARLKIEAKDRIAAKNLLLQQLKCKPNSAEAYRLLGICKETDGDNANAICEFERAKNFAYNISIENRSRFVCECNAYIFIAKSQLYLEDPKRTWRDCNGHTLAEVTPKNLIAEADNILEDINNGVTISAALERNVRQQRERFKNVIK